MDDVLLRFLRAGLINVQGDDDKFGKLQQTSRDLAVALTKMPTSATAFALIAFDPEAPVDDPVVAQALAALTMRWNTYVNTFSGPPIAVVRAMLLDALAQAASEDERIGVAFVTSARNALPFIEGGDEQAIWADVVSAIEKKVDARAEAEWATPDSIAVGPMKVDIPAIGAVSLKAATLKRPWLAAKVRAAGGPQFHDPTQGNQNTDGNPYWMQNNPTQWVTEFGAKLSDAIADAMEAVAEKTTIEQPDVAAPLKVFAEGLGAYVETTLNAVSGATAGLQRRTNLLWWKEALYSPSARVRYRELSPSAAAALMGFDLHQQVPSFSPASVAAFLFEAVEGLPGIEAEKRYTIRSLVAEAQSALAAVPLREAAGKLTAAPQGRGPVLALIGHADLNAGVTEDDFRRLTGLRATAELTLPAWAVWLFRELQAARAVTDGGAPKRRAKKA